MDLISRKQAIASGLSRYYTGIPCKRGHCSERRTLDSMCVECLGVLSQRPAVKDKARLRASAWYADNKRRALDRSKQYRSQHASEIAENSERYRGENKQRIIQMQAAYRARKQGELSERQRRAYAVIGGPRWIKVATSAARRRAGKAGVPFDDSAVREFLRTAGTHCPVFGVKFTIGTGRGWADASPTLDRVIPELGYVKGNLSLISWRANRLKSDASARELRAIADWLDSLVSLERQIAA